MLSSQSQEAHAKVGNVLKILPGSVKQGLPFGWIFFNFHGLVVAESNNLLLKKNTPTIHSSHDKCFFCVW